MLCPFKGNRLIPTGALGGIRCSISISETLYLKLAVGHPVERVFGPEALQVDHLPVAVQVPDGVSYPAIRERLMTTDLPLLEA